MNHMLYVTPDSIKALAPDMIQTATTRYNDPLYRACLSASRAVDRYCRRTFFPQLATRYFDGNGQTGMWVPDLLSVTTVSLSEDDGETYEDLTTDDWIGLVSFEMNDPRSYNRLIMNVNGDYTTWHKGQKSVKIAGVWGYADDRDAAWEDSGLTLAADMASGATSLSAADVDADDRFGLGQALVLGRLIRIDDEYMLVTAVDADANTATVVGARNGTSAAAHTAGDAIYIWRPPMDVVSAAGILAVRHMARAQQGFFDARGGDAFGGEVRWVGRMDDEARMLLGPYVRLGLG